MKHGISKWLGRWIIISLMLCRFGHAEIPGGQVDGWWTDHDGKSYQGDMRSGGVRKTYVPHNYQNPLAVKPAQKPMPRPYTQTREFQQLMRGARRKILRIDKDLSSVANPQRVVQMNTDTTTSFFQVRGSISPSHTATPVGFTPGSRISSENLRRSLSILAHISKLKRAGGLSGEDEHFLMSQATNALQEAVPLQITVAAAPLKRKPTRSQVKEFEVLFNDMARLQVLIKAKRAEHSDMRPGLHQLETEYHRAMDEKAPNVKELEVEYRKKLSAYARSHTEEFKARRKLSEMQKQARKMLNFYVDFELPKGR